MNSDPGRQANLAVLGAGAWGTAFAIHCARRHRVKLWGRNLAAQAALRDKRENIRYLPGVRFPAGLMVVDDLAVAINDADLIVIATPSAAIPELLPKLESHPATPTLLLSKGFVLPVGGGVPELVHQRVQAARAGTWVGLLTGPSFAAEVGRALPTAVVLAGNDAATTRHWLNQLHNETFRIYSSDDMIGVAVGGAVKNVMAIAAGISDGLGFGHNARAAMITRGLAEISRLAEALGGQRETLMGLAGMGDLVLTCTGDLSRNRRVGLALAAGKPLSVILAELGQVAEGVTTAERVVQVADKHQLDLPITRAVQALLKGTLSPRAAVERLLARAPRGERED